MKLDIGDWSDNSGLVESWRTKPLIATLLFINGWWCNITDETDNVCGAVVMAEPLWKFTHSSLDESKTAASGRQP